MNTKARLIKIIFSGLLIFTLAACTRGVTLTESKVTLYEGQTLNPKDYLDNKDKDNPKITIINKVDTSKSGNYEIIYKINGKETTLKVEVLSDPITLLEDNVVIESGGDFDPLEFLSNEDKANDVDIVNNVDVSKAGEYIVVYSFSGIDKVLNVLVKNVDLVLKEEAVSIDLGSSFDPRAYLGGSFPLSDKIKILNSVDTQKIGTYTVRYTLGTTSKTLKVTVKDVSPILLQTSVSIKQGSLFDPKNYLVESDRTNTDINIDSNVNTSVPGNYTVTYSLNDLTKTLQVTVTKVTVSTSYTLKVISVSSPVSAGSYADITVQGKAGKTYSIVVYYKSGPSTAAGLEPQVADDSGQVTWTWKVGSRTTAGSWKIVISGDGKTTSVYFTVT